MVNPTIYQLIQFGINVIGYFSMTFNGPHDIGYDIIFLFGNCEGSQLVLPFERIAWHPLRIIEKGLRGLVDRDAFGSVGLPVNPCGAGLLTISETSMGDFEGASFKLFPSYDDLTAIIAGDPRLIGRIIGRDKIGATAPFAFAFGGKSIGHGDHS
jgi:hypothetical protein